MALLDPRSNELSMSKLYSASIIGATDTGSTRIWIRLYAVGNWSLVVSKTPFTGDLVHLQGKSIQNFLAHNKITAVFIGNHLFSYDTNLTHTFDVSKLTTKDGKPLDPDTVYYYAVMTDNLDIERRTEIGYDQPKWFRTMPKKTKELAFGFYSCHDHISANGNSGAWPHFLEQLEDNKAQFVIGGGDQIYVDTNAKLGFPDIWEWLKKNKDDLLKQYLLDPKKAGKNAYDQKGIYTYLLDIYRWYYRVYWQVGPLQQIYGRYPQYMIWDDHEIMDGWGSLTSQERLNRLSRRFKSDDPKTDAMLIDLTWKAACRAYYEYEHSHNPKTVYDESDPDKCQWDYDFKQGNSAFYVLDMRGHHDMEKNLQLDPYLILGRPQFARFEAWLKAESVSSAKTLFVVLPVPILHWIDSLVNYADLGGLKDDFMDEWDHKSNEVERNQMLLAVFSSLEKKGKTLVFLSGDVHCASVFKLTHKKFLNAKVFQVTSSAVSRKPAPKVSMLGITAGGVMRGNSDVYSERLFALTGNKNFAMIKVRQDIDQCDEVIVDLCWPNGDEQEISKKRIVLK